MRKTTMAEEAAERDIEARWNREPSLRAEFCDDFSACRAYHMAVARGNAKHTKQNVRTFGVIEAAPPAAPVPADRESSARAAATRQLSGDPFREALRRESGRESLRARWNADAALRAEFADDFELFEAFERAASAGRVKILWQPIARPRDAGPAAARSAAPLASATDAPVSASVSWGSTEFSSFDDFYAWRRGFAAQQIAEGKLDEAVFRSNMTARWNEMARAQGGSKQ